MQSLRQPPFPALQRIEDRWEASLSMPAWAEFRLPDAQLGDEVVLSVAIPNYELTQPSSEQAAAFEFFVDNQVRVRDAILAALLAQYPRWQGEFGFDDEEREEYMPDVKNAEDFEPLLQLSGIHVFNTAKEGCAYIGLICHCQWDDEHGFGAMVHRDRVLKIGGADTGILEWIAERDAA